MMNTLMSMTASVLIIGMLLVCFKLYRIYSSYITKVQLEAEDAKRRNGGNASKYEDQDSDEEEDDGTDSDSSDDENFKSSKKKKK